MEWSVREIDAGRLPNARGPHALLFESQKGWRLCWAYPANWHGLSDEALATLSVDCPR